MTALITGASSGIGLELARIVAANHHDVVLVARGEARLRALAQELDAVGVRAHIILADLSDPAAPRVVVERVNQLRLDIDVLVNNAGYGLQDATARARGRESRLRCADARRARVCSRCVEQGDGAGPAPAPAQRRDTDRANGAGTPQIE